MVTLPGLEDAATVPASELLGFAGVHGAVVRVFVAVVATVVVAVAGPQPGDAFAVAAGEGLLGRTRRSHAGHPVALVLSCHGFVDALLALVDGLEPG